MDSARLAPAGTVAPATPSFKYCVYCYSDMMRPTGQETSTIDKLVCRSQHRLRSACHTTRGHVGERQVVRDAEGPGEEVGERLHRDVCEDEQVWPGKYSSRSESPGPTADPAPGHRGLLGERVPSERVTRAFPLPPRAMLHVDALAADTRVTSSWVLRALCLRSDR